MPTIRKIDDTFAVCDQLDADDIAQARSQGFRTIINNRPDGEGGPEQPNSSDNRKAAEAAGLTYHYIPVSGPAPTTELVETFRHAVEDGPGPILAHCKSGARSAMLWGLAEACRGARGTDDILGQLARQGYDFSQMRPLFEQFAAAKKN